MIFTSERKDFAVGGASRRSPAAKVARRATAVLCATLMLTAVTHATAGAQQSGLNANISSVREGEYPDARAIVNFVDSSGVDVSSLTAANFSATVDGTSSAVSSASLASSQNVPLDVLFVIDTSGSMNGDPIAQAKAAAKGFVGQLAPIDRVAIISFNSTITVVQDYSADRVATSAAIDALVARSTTDLYGATGTAAVKAASSTSPRRAVILLSDGAQEGVTSRISREAAISAAAGVGVPFFAIGEGKSIDRSYLGSLADATRGKYLEAPNASQLTALYANIGQLLLSQYIVTFDASQAAGKASAQVSVQVRIGGATATAATTFAPSAGFAPPKVEVSGLQAGESLTAPREVTVAVGGKVAATRAAFTVDGVNVFESTVAPYTFSYDPKAFGSGAHSLKVSVQVGTALIDSAAIGFSSIPPASTTPASGGNGGAGLPVLPLVAGAGGMALLAAFAFVVMKRGGGEGMAAMPPADQRITPWVGRPRSIVAPSEDLVPEDEAPAEDIGEPMGILIARGGSDFGQEYAVGGKPASIGSGAACALRIADAAFSAEEARLWVRKGHLMVHKMTRLSVIASAGVSGGWEILAPGDTFELGEHTYEFRLLPPYAPVPEARPGVPNILKDPDVPRRLPVLPIADAPSADLAPRLTEMMPHDLGFETNPDQRAS